MIKKFYTLLKDYDGHKEGETIELDEGIGKALVVANLVKEAPEAPESLVQKATEQLSDKITELVSSIVPQALAKAVGGLTLAAGTIITPGEAEADKTKSFSDFLVNVAQVGDPVHGGDAHERLTKVYQSKYNDWSEKPDPENPKKTLATTTGSSGGYTMGTAFYQQIMEIAGETAIIRPRATVIPMTAMEVDIPALDQTTVPQGGSAYMGGVVVSWNAEGFDADETQPKFRQAKLKAHGITAYTEVTRELLRVSPISLDSLIFRLFGNALAWAEDLAFLRGDGTKMPHGFINAPAFLLTTAARASATAISEAEIDKMWVSLLPASRSKVLWLGATGATEDALLTMLRTSNIVQVVNNTAANRAVNTETTYLIKGRPLMITEKLPDLNTNGDFVAFDPSMYLVGDLDAMEIATSEHFKFRSNKVAYRLVHHVAGMPWLSAPIPSANNANFKMSPFVGLKKNG